MRVGIISFNREIYKMRNDSIIVDNMCGVFKSTLRCPDCQKISITFDPYFSVSIPIPDSSKIKLQLYVLNKNNVPSMIDLYLYAS